MKPTWLFEYETKRPYKTLVAIPDLRHDASRRVIAYRPLGRWPMQHLVVIPGNYRCDHPAVESSLV